MSANEKSYSKEEWALIRFYIDSIEHIDKFTPCDAIQVVHSDPNIEPLFFREDGVVSTIMKLLLIRRYEYVKNLKTLFGIEQEEIPLKS